MRWTVLADNRTNDPAMETEHGLSILLETERRMAFLSFWRQSATVYCSTREPATCLSATQNG